MSCYSGKRNKTLNNGRCVVQRRALPMMAVAALPSRSDLQAMGWGAPWWIATERVPFEVGRTAGGRFLPPMRLASGHTVPSWRQKRSPTIFSLLDQSALARSGSRA